MKIFRKNSIAKSIYVYSFFNYFGSVLIFGITASIFLLLTNRLSVEQYGQYNIVLNTQFFLTMLLNLGLSSLIIRFVPEYIAKEDFFTAKKIVFSSILITFSAGVLIFSTSALLFNRFSFFLSRFFIRDYFLLIIIVSILRAEVVLCEGCFSAFLKQRYKVFIEILGTSFKLVLFIYSIQQGFGITGLILSIGIIDLILFIAYFLRINVYLKISNKLQGSLKKLRVVKYAAKEYLNKVLSFFWYTKIDGYIIALLLGLSQAGVYYFVLNLVSVLGKFLPASLLQPVSIGVFSRQYAKNNNPKDIIYLFRLYNKLNAFIIFPIFLVLILLTDKILFLFFDKYIHAIYLFPIMLISVLIYILSLPLKNVFMTLEKNQISIYSSLVILYKIPALYFLTKFFGLIGSAVALASSMIVYFLIQLSFTKRHIEINYPWKAFLKVSVNSLVVGFLVFCLRGLVGNILSLFFVIFIAAGAYLLVSFFNKVFEDHDRQILNEPFSRIILNF